MKTTTGLSVIATCLGLYSSLLLSSCAPDPTLQKEMDQDILQASENKKTDGTSKSQQGTLSSKHHQGGF